MRYETNHVKSWHSECFEIFEHPLLGVMGHLHVVFERFTSSSDGKTIIILLLMKNGPSGRKGTAVCFTAFVPAGPGDCAALTDLSSKAVLALRSQEIDVP